MPATSASKRLAKATAIAEELGALYRRFGGLDPRMVVKWAAGHPESALHSRFQWDDTRAAREYRLQQARQLIVEVEVEYPDGKVRQVYVSPIRQRKRGGYLRLVDVMNRAELRAEFLAEALAEYRRVGAKYQDLRELTEVRRAVAVASRKARRKRGQSEARA